jgi:hypothetical protein
MELITPKIIDDYISTHKISDRIISNIGRIYSINEKEYPSITTMLSKTADKTYLEEWRKRIGDEEADKISKAACARGTSMHNLIENHFKGLYLDETEIGFSLYQQLIPFLENIKPIGIEVPLYSNNLKIAGRTDLIGYNKENELCIYDWKTSKRQKTKSQINDYILQSIFYAIAAYECIGISIKTINILIASDEGFPVLFKENVTIEKIRELNQRVKQYYGELQC